MPGSRVLAKAPWTFIKPLGQLFKAHVTRVLIKKKYSWFLKQVSGFSGPF